MSTPTQSGGTRSHGAQSGRARVHPSRAAVRGHPIHPMLIPLPIGLLVGAAVTDVLYVFTADEFFARMSLWLIGGGLLTGAVAMIPGAVDFFSIRRPRETRMGIVHAVGNALVLAVTAVNLVWRAVADRADVIEPWGLVLSLVVAALLAVTGWAGGELSYRHMIGVDPIESGAGEPRERSE